MTEATARPNVRARIDTGVGPIGAEGGHRTPRNIEPLRLAGAATQGSGRIKPA